MKQVVFHVTRRLAVLSAVLMILLATPAYAGVLEDCALQAINAQRTAVGEAPLEIDADLNQVAVIRAEEAAQEFAHVRPGGGNPLDMIREAWKGENLAWVSGKTEEEAANAEVSNMMASAMHKNNLLFGEFRKIGIASYTQNGKTITAYMFSS